MKKFTIFNIFVPKKFIDLFRSEEEQNTPLDKNFYDLSYLIRAIKNKIDSSAPKIKLFRHLVQNDTIEENQIGTHLQNIIFEESDVSPLDVDIINKDNVEYLKISVNNKFQLIPFIDLDVPFTILWDNDAESFVIKRKENLIKEITPDMYDENGNFQWNHNLDTRNFEVDAFLVGDFAELSMEIKVPIVYLSTNSISINSVKKRHIKLYLKRT